MDDNLEALRESLKKEILRSSEILAGLILDSNTNPSVSSRELPTYDPNLSSNVTNGIDFVYNIIMKEMGNTINIQAQIKNYQEKSFNTLTNSISEGNRSMAELLE
jgi:hypothetical protein